MAFNTINPPQVDSLGRAVSRTLLQFRQSPVFHQILAALVMEIQALNDAARDVMVLRGPNDALGENLNALGRIVGQDRVIFDYNLIGWFAPDMEGQGADQAPAWVTGAPLTESIEAEDSVYRKLIEGRVYRNFSNFGSVPEIQEMVEVAMSSRVSIMRVGIMTVELGVPDFVPYWVARFLARFETDQLVEERPYPPYPATMSIEGIVYMPDNWFAPDMPGRGADVGVAAVKQYL